MKLKKGHFWNPKKPEDQTPAQRAVAGGCGAVILLVLVLIAIKAFTPENPRPVVGNAEATGQAPQQVAQPVPELPDATVRVSAVVLSKAFHENEARASQQYSGVPLEVTGKVKSIMLDITGEPMVLLRGSGDVYGAGFTNDGKMSDVRVTGLSKEAAGRIEKGQTVGFRCQGVAVFVGSPQLTDCVPL